MYKFTLNQSRLLHSCRHVRSRLDRACFYGTNAGNAFLKNRTLVRFQRKEIFDRGRVLANSVRRYSSANDGEKEKAVSPESNVKKQLKSEDLFRILSLAKPEYKSLAGKH